eukprot:1732751-Rhodomonas_salina.1
MAARIEGSVCIAKEHLQCMTRAANAPLRFWVYTMKHFCRTHGYWAGKGGTAPPWTKMPKSKLCQDFQRDIQ